MINKLSMWALVPVVSLVSACSSDNASQERDPEALAERIEQVFLDEGATPTESLPTGSASYTGLIGAERDDPDFENDMGYLADLRLAVNFDDQSVTGDITNFETDVPDFENPSGSAVVTGSVVDDIGVAGISFEAIGTLESGTIIAEYDMFEANGTFGGNDGRVVAGEQFTDFEWITGPNADPVGDSFFLSDGYFGAERD